MKHVDESKKKILGINPVIFVTGLVSLFTDLLSEMTSVLHAQVGAVGVIEGVAESIASVLKLFSGWISDRIEKRNPLMIVGYGFSHLVNPLFAVPS